MSPLHEEEVIGEFAGGEPAEEPDKAVAEPVERAEVRP